MKFSTVTASAAAILMAITDEAKGQPCVKQATSFKECLEDNGFTGCYDCHVNAFNSMGGSCTQEALNNYCSSRESCFELCGGMAQFCGEDFKAWNRCRLTFSPCSFSCKSGFIVAKVDLLNDPLHAVSDEITSEEGEAEPISFEDDFAALYFA